MNTEPDEPERYCIRGLSPSDAALFFDALEQADIDFHADYIEEPVTAELEGDSPQTNIVVSIDPRYEDAVRSIEAKLFDDET